MLTWTVTDTTTGATITSGADTNQLRATLSAVDALRAHLTGADEHHELAWHVTVGEEVMLVGATGPAVEGRTNIPGSLRHLDIISGQLLGDITLYPTV